MVWQHAYGLMKKRFIALVRNFFLFPVVKDCREWFFYFVIKSE